MACPGERRDASELGEVAEERPKRLFTTNTGQC
jgi:hypothetical protein